MVVVTHLQISLRFFLPVSKLEFLVSSVSTVVDKRCRLSVRSIGIHLLLSSLPRTQSTQVPFRHFVTSLFPLPVPSDPRP